MNLHHLEESAIGTKHFDFTIHKLPSTIPLYFQVILFWAAFQHTEGLLRRK